MYVCGLLVFEQDNSKLKIFSFFYQKIFHIDIENNIHIIKSYSLQQNKSIGLYECILYWELIELISTEAAKFTFFLYL